MPDLELTVKQAAAILKVHHKTVRRYLKQGKLQWTKVQGRYGEEYRISRQSLEQLSRGSLSNGQPSLDKEGLKELLAAVELLTARIASLESTIQQLALPPAREEKKPWWRQLFKRGE